jgi:hypothetical protein
MRAKTRLGLADADADARNGHKPLIYGVPKGIRTPVTAVKGRCPGPLDDGDVDLTSPVWWS